MPDILQVILLGIIEGITEFLPISSTGHLLIAEHWLGGRSELFNVAIQSGAMLAIVLIYRHRLWNLAAHFAQPGNRDYLGKLMLSFAITAAGGLAAKKLGLTLPETVNPVAWALILGGFAIFAVERRVADARPSAHITWDIAVWVGLAQILAAVFPGTSRSLATIFAAMLAGCNDRAAATEFAFLVGIPTMFAATGYELLKLRGQAAGEPLGDLALGFVVSAVVAFAAVRWLLGYIRAHRFTLFARYRILAGALLLTIT